MQHDSLLALLRENKLTLTPTFDGSFLRDGSQWFKGQVLTVGERTIYWACFGDFARNISKQWVSSEKLSHTEQEAVNKAVLLANSENRRAREEHWEKLRPEIENEWEDFSDIGTTPYTEKKGFKELYGCRVEAHEKGARLIVPARDVQGVLWGYQRIYSEKLSEIGTDKIFRKGARKEGCFHALGELAGASSIYLCEGISTAVAVRAAIEGVPVVSVFDAGNLLSVASALRESFPSAHFIFCADNDKFPSRDGRIYYTGFRKAEQALKAVGNGRIVVPSFSPDEDREHPTDFDDLARLRGLEEVKRQILSEPERTSTPSATRGLTPIDSKNKKGESTKPAESIVALNLLKWYGDNLLVQGKDVFIYGAGCWEHQDEAAINDIKQNLAHLYGLKATARDIDGAYKYFLLKAPRARTRRNLFVPPYLMANFQNGTLHLTPVPGARPKLDFRPHAKEDYLTTMLPFDFPGLDKLEAVNPEFAAMLERVFKGDSDKDDKIRVLAQMFGAVIMPCYPKIFFLVGKKGSGKSTVCKILNRLVDDKNISRVDPSSFRDFNMSTMAGKLLNMDTDIDLHKPINDAVIKKIIDRIPFRIQRKFQDDVLAPLAPVHVYGGNDLPTSYEGESGAYERRVVIVRFGSFSAEALGTGYDLDFDQLVWAAGWEGILAFALRGLIDLVESKGHFHVPQSSKDALKEWDHRSDPLSQFLAAMEHKELDKGNQYYLAPEAEITRKEMWQTFNDWQVREGDRRAPWNAAKLYDAMRRRGFRDKMVRGTRFFVGIGSVPNPEMDV